MITPYKSKCGYFIQPVSGDMLQTLTTNNPTLNIDISNQLFTPDENLIGMLDNSTFISMAPELMWKAYRPSYKQLLAGYCKTVNYNLVYAKKTLNTHTQDIEFPNYDKFYRLALPSDRWPWALLCKIKQPLPETILYISINVLTPKP